MSFSGKKLLFIGIFLMLLIGIPLTVYLAQQQQANQSHAAASTTLTITPASTQVAPLQHATGDMIPLDIMINPGKNIVQSVTLDIIYDPAALSVDTTSGFQANTVAFPTLTGGPTYSPGRMTVSLSTVGSQADITSGITTPTKVGTITVKALAPTNLTQVTFGEKVAALSIAGPKTGSNDSAGENVLLPPDPAYITLVAGTGSGQLTPTGTGGTQATNAAPSCTALNVDRSTSGTAPLALTFTAVGNDTDGTINKATFNFGDGPTQDVTTGGNIGTKSVSVQLAHQYNNAGTYPVSVILTDNQGMLSDRQSCTQTVVVAAAPVVNSGSGSNGGTTKGGTVTGSTAAGGTTTAGAGALATGPTAPPAPMAALPKTGPGDKFIIAGSAVAVITLLGGIIFLAL